MEVGEGAETAPRRVVRGLVLVGRSGVWELKGLRWCSRVVERGKMGESKSVKSVELV